MPISISVRRQLCKFGSSGNIFPKIIRDQRCCWYRRKIATSAIIFPLLSTLIYFLSYFFLFLFVAPLSLCTVSFSSRSPFLTFYLSTSLPSFSFLSLNSPSLLSFPFLSLPFFLFFLLSSLFQFSSFHSFPSSSLIRIDGIRLTVWKNQLWLKFELCVKNG